MSCYYYIFPHSHWVLKYVRRFMYLYVYLYQYAPKVIQPFICTLDHCDQLLSRESYSQNIATIIFYRHSPTTGYVHLKATYHIWGCHWIWLVESMLLFCWIEAFARVESWQCRRWIKNVRHENVFFAFRIINAKINLWICPLRGDKSTELRLKRGVCSQQSSRE